MSLTVDDIKILKKMFEDNNVVLENRLDAKFDAKLTALEQRMELKMEYMIKGMRIGIKSELQDMLDQKFDVLYAFLNDHFDKFVLKSEIRPECLKLS